MKKIDVISWLLLVIVLVTTYKIHTKLDLLRTDIQQSSMPKLMITDNEQFQKLCDQFNSQWEGKGYIVYILQPNSNLKTHKELATSTVKNAPLRLKIKDYPMEKVDNYYTGNTENLEEITEGQMEIDSNFIMVPIYKHNIIVAEMYILYDSLPENFSNKVEEAQVMAHVLQ